MKLRWSASALSEHRVGGYGKSLLIFVEGARTLEQVDTNTAKNQLELSVLFMALFSYSQDIDAAGYTARAQKLVEAEGSAADSTKVLQTVHFAE